MAVMSERQLGADGGEQHSIYQDISERLAVGEFDPGTRMKADDLRHDYGVSAATIREILFRLSYGGYVVFEEQRGFRVPPPSLKKLLEIRHLRTLVETEGARLSIRNGGMEWEARLNAAHHKLVHVELKMRDNPDAKTRENIAMWTRCDWEFHETLVSACESDLLMETLHSLFFKYRQYLVALVTDYGFRIGTVGEHKQILDAALARDVAACETAISEHYAFIDEFEQAPARGLAR